MTDGGYDAGYIHCPCFWGRSPGSLMVRLEAELPTYRDLSVLDVGCGEGKNAVYLAQQGAHVKAFDVSEAAIANAKRAWPEAVHVEWEVADVRTTPLRENEFDIVIAYGLTHCLSSPEEVQQTITRLQAATTTSGYHVLCAFNDRHQDLSAHPGFHPCLIKHAAYVALYTGWRIVEASDTNLVETHPHNEIEHTHSMTRLVAQKQ